MSKFKTELLKDIKDYLHYDKNVGTFWWKDTPPMVTKPKIGKNAITKRLTKSQNRLFVRYKKIYFLAHCLAWFYEYGTWPNNFIVHKNGDVTDNRIENLEQISHRKMIVRGYLRRKLKKNVEYLPGANPLPNGKFNAVLKIGRRVVWSKCFGTKEEAHQAYLSKAEELDNA